MSTLQGNMSTLQRKSSGEQPLFLAKDFQVVYRVVVVNGDGIKCRALLDTGAGSSYISSSLANRLKNIQTDRNHVAYYNDKGGSIRS